jgi:anaerobic magnesium-protoporphyrin IX monomethyl ester cyclase
VLYTYTPVPLDGGLYAEARRLGFAFPETLEQWATPRWQQLSMRRGDGIPWLDGGVRRRVRNFERVINAYYPTVTDSRLTRWHRAALKAASAWRYALKCYGAPYELRALHRMIQYQRPETTGF